MVNLEVFKQKACFQNRWISRALWFVSTSRNASVLIFSCLAAYLLEINGLNQLTLSGITKRTGSNGVQSSLFTFRLIV